MCALAPVAAAVTYSLYTHKESRLEQQHGLQRVTLTLCFYKNIYQNVVYIYTFMNVFLKQIYLYGFLISKFNNLKVTHDLYF
jgi:hypothetical protein